MDKPLEKFRRGSIAYARVENDLEDLTMREIAEVLLTDTDTVRTTIHYIKRRSGYAVPYKRAQKGERARELYKRRNAIL